MPASTTIITMSTAGRVSHHAGDPAGGAGSGVSSSRPITSPSTGTCQRYTVMSRAPTTATTTRTERRDTSFVSAGCASTSRQVCPSASATIANVGG
jgi:hypothetical protein